MAESISSQKKIDYINSTGEFLAVAKDSTIKALEEILAVTNKAKVACADRASNVLFKVGNAQLEVIASGGKGLIEFAEALKTGTMVGEALVKAANKALDEWSPLAAKPEEFPLIADSVISSRGLDENWTAAVQNEYTNACMSFIQIRENLLRDLAESTRALSGGDFDDLYKDFGRKLEADCNELTKHFNNTMTLFEAAGVNLAKMQDNARQSTASVGNIDMSNIGADEEL